mmetsp:Transcript_14762/g.29605  ORF Transcript_14762/g.29605 Transcript_14762/m.29605 type:complete len:214 (+) Transcript_14762:8666-9307(+)
MLSPAHGLGSTVSRSLSTKTESNGIPDALTRMAGEFCAETGLRTSKDMAYRVPISVRAVGTKTILPTVVSLELSYTPSHVPKFAVPSRSAKTAFDGMSHDPSVAQAPSKFEMVITEQSGVSGTFDASVSVRVLRSAGQGEVCAIILFVNCGVKMYIGSAERSRSMKPSALDKPGRLRYQSLYVEGVSTWRTSKANSKSPESDICSSAACRGCI